METERAKKEGQQWEKERKLMWHTPITNTATILLITLGSVVILCLLLNGLNGILFNEESVNIILYQRKFT